MINTTHKKCECSIDDWEIIVVDHEEAFDDKSVIFHHCNCCGEDFAVTDFFSGDILYYFNPYNTKRLQNSKKQMHK